MKIKATVNLWIDEEVPECIEAEKEKETPKVDISKLLQGIDLSALLKNVNKKDGEK